MRILMMTRFYLNGQTTHVLSLTKELIRQGHEVFLNATYLNSPSYTRWLRSNHIPYSSIIGTKSLSSFAKEFGFDVIHTHSTHTLEASLCLRQSLGIPVVATCHYLGFPGLDGLSKVDARILISYEMLASYSLPSHNTFVIENGVPIPRQVETSLHHIPRILLLTRMTRSKQESYSYLVEVLHAKGWNITSVGNWIPPYGIPHYGWTVDPYPFLQRADIVVGTGRSIREGMACGCAAIVLGQYADGIVRQENVDSLRATNFSGRAFRHISSVKYWEDELAKLAAEIPHLKTFGRQYALRHFGLEAMTRKTIGVYEQTVC